MERTQMINSLKHELVHLTYWEIYTLYILVRSFARR